MTISSHGLPIPSYEASVLGSPQCVHCPSCGKQQLTVVHLTRRRNLIATMHAVLLVKYNTSNMKVQHSCSLCHALIATCKGFVQNEALPTYNEALVFYDKRKNTIHVGTQGLS